MCFSISAGIDNPAVNGIILPVEAFTVSFDHFIPMVHNPVILRLCAQNGAAENIRVIPSKFWLDPNLKSHHKHALSVSLRHVKHVVSKRVIHRVPQHKT
jgi:hypothetical protein